MTHPATPALLEAVSSGDWEAVAAALQDGASPFETDLSGHNALLLALAHAQEDIALAIVGAMTQLRPDRAWLSTTSRTTGLNAIGQAVLSRRQRALAALLALAGPQAIELVTQCAPSTGECAFHLAVREAAPRGLALLLRATPQALETASKAGLTPLAIALVADNESIVKVLLEAGADLAHVPAGAVVPAWAWVASAGMLTDLGQQLDWAKARTPDGGTLLHVLAGRGPELRMPLWRLAYRQWGAELGALTDHRGRTALHVAVRANASPEVIDGLTATGCLWEQADRDGETALELLAQKRAAGWKIDALSARWEAQATSQRLESRLQPARAEGTPAKRL